MKEIKGLILIADVARNNYKSGHDFQSDLQILVKYINKIYGESILSPFSFHPDKGLAGVVVSVSTGLDIVLAIEEYILEEAFDFKLRFVLYEGMVVIPEVEGISLGGSGVEHAKLRMSDLRKDQARYYVSANDSTIINKMMRVIQHFIDSWHPKDRATVAGFLQGHDYKAMAIIEQKDESSLWRRRKSLAIDEYLICKDLISHLVED